MVNSMFVVYYSCEDSYKPQDDIHGLFETYEKAYNYVKKEERLDLFFIPEERKGDLLFMPDNMSSEPNIWRNKEFKILNMWFSIQDDYTIYILEYEIQ